MTQEATKPGGRWLALPVILTGVFMTILDFSIVNVAIPSIQADLHASAAEIQLVVAGYSLTYGCGLITGGRLGDRFGRRQLFTVGVALFTLASIACGVASTALVLVIARLVQGACSAVLFPQALSLLNVTYTGADRARAFRIYGLVLGLATACGQVLGGLLIRVDVLGLGWRGCFLINIPFGLAAVALSLYWLTESRSETAKRIDGQGAALVTLALVFLVLPLVEGRQAGWPLWSFLSMAASVAVFVLFLYRQKDLIEPVLLRSRPFLAGVGTVLATYAGMGSFFLVLAVYLQDGRGYAPLASGVAFLPVGIAFMVTSLSGAHVARLLGRYSITIGAVLLAGSELALALVAKASPNGWALVPPLTAVGCAMGIVMTPLISHVLAGVHPDHAGSASGVLSTMQQVGNSLGVALIGVVFYGTLGARGEYSRAFQFGMGYTAITALVVAILAVLASRLAHEAGAARDNRVGSTDTASAPSR
jgi:EmrB/QacA subfamily drug resistance transporter